MHAEIAGTAYPPQGEGQGFDGGALAFKVRNRAFQMLISYGPGGWGRSVPENDDTSAIEITPYPSVDFALQYIAGPDCWLLACARNQISIVYRDSLLIVPEHQWILLRADDVDADGFQDFCGSLLLMPMASISPHDRKLLVRQAGVATFCNGWGRLLGAYLESLDLDTLRVVGREESGWSLVEHQVMALLRRALLERLGNLRFWSRRGAEAPGTQSRGEWLFKNICDWMANNYTNPDINSEFVASHFNVSPRYIQNLFSRYGEGATFVSFLREKRLRRAWEMLVDVEYAHQNISEICWNCGFSDPVYFGKMFRGFFGVTPGQARRQGLREDR
uniref:helix-turn-helix domain-containing protein n=1 Tax=Castellaniella defragrans TaxID=75697 RepID=UPI00333EB6EA